LLSVGVSLTDKNYSWTLDNNISMHENNYEFLNKLYEFLKDLNNYMAI